MIAKRVLLLALALVLLSGSVGCGRNRCRDRGVSYVPDRCDNCGP